MLTSSSKFAAPTTSIRGNNPDAAARWRIRVESTVLMELEMIGLPRMARSTASSTVVGSKSIGGIGTTIDATSGNSSNTCR